MDQRPKRALPPAYALQEPLYFCFSPSVIRLLFSEGVEGRKLDNGAMPKIYLLNDRCRNQAAGVMVRQLMVDCLMESGRHIKCFNYVV